MLQCRLIRVCGLTISVLISAVSASYTSINLPKEP